MLCSRIPLPESIVLATIAKLEFYLSAGKKKREEGWKGEQSMEICCLSVTPLIFSPISPSSLFLKVSLVIIYKTLSASCTPSAMTHPNFFFFLSVIFLSLVDPWPFEHLPHLISTKLKSCSAPLLTLLPLLLSSWLFFLVAPWEIYRIHAVIEYQRWRRGFCNGVENYKGLSVRHICLPNVISV